MLPFDYHPLDYRESDLARLDINAPGECRDRVGGRSAL